MAVNVIYTKVLELLKRAGIDPQKFIGTIDPNKIKKLTTKTEKTATKPKLIDALNKDKATFGDALKIFENEAKYISQMNEMELTNFANNLQDYFTVGGKVKYTPSNVVTTEGTPVVGKKLETLSSRKGAAGKADDTSLQGSMEGLMSLVDDLKGISPKMRNQMNRDELAKFLQKMRGRKFTNDEIKLVREYMDQYGIGLAKEKGAPAMEYAKKLGAKNKEEFQFIEEYLDNIQSYSPQEFREMFDVKKINMDLSDLIERKLEKHFKKKYKWDDTKRDGGLDEITYEKYEDDLYETGKEFSDFHRTYDSSAPFGESKYQSWSNNPKNWIDEASEKLQSITGDGLNVDFYKSYTDDVLGKYPKPEKFQYGGPVIKGPDMGATAHGSGELLARSRILQPGGQTTTSTGLNYLLGEDDTTRIPFAGGKLVDMSRRGFLKFVGGTAASIAALKSGLVKLMGGKNPEQVKKVIDEVVIAKETGAPEWFQPLVNKILREGKDTDITYSERQIGKVMETPSGKVDVIYKMDTGEVELSFVGKNTALGEQVDLIYKPGQADEMTKGAKPADEFIASETVPEGVRTGPDDYSIELGVNESSNVGDLSSDLTELKTFATGKQPTMKEIVEGIKKKKTRAKMEKDQGIDYITETQGDYPYASGGLARLLGE
jgi:hypothetical protein